MRIRIAGRPIAAGALLALVGLMLAVAAVALWARGDFGPLEYGVALRLVVPSSSLLVLGCQTIFASFFISILGLSRG